MNALGNLRILDQQVDKSLWAIEPTEAAKYQFIWDKTFPGSSRIALGAASTPFRRRRDVDEHTLASIVTELPRDKKGSSPTESRGNGRLLGRSLSRMQQVLTPRKHRRRLSQQEKTEYITEDEYSTSQEYDASRRYSESTLVGRLSCEEERQQPER
ncbi:hypothetical protein NQ176_g11114 [Zarea fungicola]|uniref:Uncharacterized protein n=1 Tax=Zarea fungicola TaxID=93591 RepID=A0ACC1ME36_9HYPO|nr:hypothetical protein NQ176_g11114 [Lecanicillium fungicola]